MIPRSQCISPTAVEQGQSCRAEWRRVGKDKEATPFFSFGLWTTHVVGACGLFETGLGNPSKNGENEVEAARVGLV